MATKKEIAAHLFMSDRHLRRLSDLPGAPQPTGSSGHSLDNWRRFYINLLKSKNGWREGEDMPGDPADDPGQKLDYEQERAKNVREQRRARRIQNELALKTLIPTEVCIEIYGSLVGAARAKILAIEGKAATELPQLAQADLEVLRGLLCDALTDLAHEPIPPSLVRTGTAY